MSFWKRARYRIEWLAVKALAIGIPLLPRRWARGLARGLGSVAYFADRRGRGTALENLRAVYGDGKSETERRQIAREAFQHFARTVIDQFWSARLTAENWERYCRLELDDPEAVADALKTGAIWVTPHYSNFEWTALVMGFRGYRFTIIAQDFKNPLLTRIFQENRQVSGHQVIPQRQSMFRLLKNLKNQGHAAFLTDLTIKPSKAATIIECMGFKTCVTALHVELMRRTRLPVIPGICQPLDDGTYRVRGLAPLRFEEGMSDAEMAQRCWDAFEPFILENPAPWLWMYKHWRYRPESGGDAYPAYAGISGKFTKLEARVESEASKTEPATAE
ncbi:MAG: hypothetical protein KDM91_04115 [Verrucomicrobiae bacterium]|nr:hypothetical protein [Verrucomicrobiae bacterium]MCP5540284.1 hypothetical protein [Akkermansiaceae bacterium]